VLPVQYEPSPADPSKRIAAQSVPTSLAVGPGGALYVGELSGYPFDRGYARVWRIAPGARPLVYARGFTSITSIAFDRSGRLLVLEIDRDGLAHPNVPGELIRLSSPVDRTVLASSGLVDPTGVAVAPDGSIYISDYGTSTGTGKRLTGEVVRLR
jgi:sugar lactone lactonase YvrE